MRFRHRVIPPEQPPLDEAGDIELSEDLLALGDRLRHDADVLATRYPACVSDEDAEFETGRLDGNSRHPRRYRYTVRAVAGLLLAVACWPAVSRLVQQTQDSRRLVTESSPESSPSGSVDQHRPPSPVPPSIDVPNMDVNPAGYHSKGTIDGTPAVFLQEVSGPELEGLLDLWEEENSTASSVSI